jgi:hypothetical protein
VSEEEWGEFEDAVLDEANPGGWEGVLFGPSVWGVTLDENGELAFIEIQEAGVGGGVVKGLARLLGASGGRTVSKVASSAAARVPGPLRSVLARGGVVPQQGFSSFGAFKRALGPAGPGRQWQPRRRADAGQCVPVWSTERPQHPKPRAARERGPSQDQRILFIEAALHGRSHRPSLAQTAAAQRATQLW